MWMDNGANKATSCAGYEMGIYNEQGEPSVNDNYWGFDCISRGFYKSSIGHLTRGRFKNAFFAGGTPRDLSKNDSGWSDEGFTYIGNGFGFVFSNLENNQGQPMIVKNNNAVVAEMYADGALRGINTARAWVNFDGNLLNPITPRNGYNVTYVQKMATGIYRIHLAIKMPNANSCVVGSFNDLGAGASTFTTTAWNTDWVEISLTRPGVGKYDHGVVNVAIFNNAY